MRFAVRGGFVRVGHDQVTILVDRAVTDANVHAGEARQELDETLDYSDLARRASAIVASERFNLIEALAERLAAEVLEDPRVARTVIRVAKPAALAGRNVDTVLVEIERER